MKTLIKNAFCINTHGGCSVNNVLVEGSKVTYVNKNLPKSEPDKVIDGSGCILTPGFVNAHCHTPMTVLRGIGSDCPLDVWLNNHIFPAEDRMNGDIARIGTMNAIAEMIRGGITSFTDMYFFCEDIADAVLETGIKANISRSIVSFDDSENPKDNFRVGETVSLIKNFHNSADGRIKIDVSLHAEYTNTERMCRYAADLAKEYGVGMQIHLSETNKEHTECIARRGMTPTAFFELCGVFDVPTNAAHCVWLTDDDINILSRCGVTAVHNPRSNLKLGSGVMPYNKLIKAGVNVALGTDGSASNNKLSIVDEMQLAAILHKGNMNDASIIPACEVFRAATAGGSLSQGREGFIEIKEGMTADLVLINCDRPGVSDVEEASSSLVYACDRNDVVMTMVDGRILFENGEYNTIDVEKISYDYKTARAELFS